MSTYNQTGPSDDVLEAESRSNVAPIREVQQAGIIEIVVRHPNLSSDLLVGVLNLEATPGQLLETLVAEIPEFVSRVETRISETRSATLPLVGVWYSVSGTSMAIEGLVRGGGF